MVKSIIPKVRTRVASLLASAADSIVTLALRLHPDAPDEVDEDVAEAALDAKIAAMEQGTQDMLALCEDIDIAAELGRFDEVDPLVEKYLDIRMSVLACAPDREHLLIAGTNKVIQLFTTAMRFQAVRPRTVNIQPEGVPRGTATIH